MTRRGWLVLGCAWWSVCAGCASTGGRVANDSLPAADPTLVDGRTTGDGAETPYHALPTRPPSGIVPVAARDAGPDHQNLYPANDDLPPPEVKTADRPPPPPPPPPPPQDPPILQALRCLLEKHSEGTSEADAVALLQNYPAANQELLLQLLPLIARLTEGGIDRADPRETAHIVEILESVAGPLRRAAPLTIDRVCYCKRITKFGDYEAYSDRKTFRPGELVQLYAEVRNVVSEPTDNVYEVRLASTVEIRDDHGKVVWRLDCPDHNRPDRSPAQRHDVFTSQMFSLPEAFAPGEYTLHLIVADLHTQKREPAGVSLPLEVTNRP